MARKMTKKMTKQQKIDEIIAKVNEITEYAINHQCTEQCYDEELEDILYKYVK